MRRRRRESGAATAKTAAATSAQADQKSSRGRRRAAVGADTASGPWAGAAASSGRVGEFRSTPIWINGCDKKRRVICGPSFTRRNSKESMRRNEDVFTKLRDHL
ncbi:hypothetical protein GCM10026982_50330 [Nocardiopsis aegyptia]